MGCSVCCHGRSPYDQMIRARLSGVKGFAVSRVTLSTLGDAAALDLHKVDEVDTDVLRAELRTG